MKIFEDKIDRLAKKQEKIELEKIKINDNKDKKNSKLETKIQKLMNKSYQNRVDAERKIAVLDRQYEKNQDLIDIEARYAQNIAKIKGSVIPKLTGTKKKAGKRDE